jgi:hypothetical protein
MPTFLLPKVQMLKDVPLGALIGFKMTISLQQPPTDQLGIRAERAGDNSPVVVLLNALDRKLGLEGLEAVVLPRTTTETATLQPNSFVLNHSEDWTLVTRPDRWDTTYTFCTFGGDTSGTLLIRNGALGLAVASKSDCTFLNLNSWQIEDVNTGNYMSTRHWGITLPGVDGKAEWLFKIADT